MRAPLLVLISLTLLRVPGLAAGYDFLPGELEKFPDTKTVEF